MTDIELKLDELIHQPVRTKIMAYLINTKQCDYTDLKNALGLSDGHMSTHMKKLIAGDYVKVEKKFEKNKPKTTYLITDKGKKNFKKYIETLTMIINQ
ncbi:MAG TPA: transcriptional regulator [Victivallales bacterium]|nr:transcriptional regulator [Victivallales bacterium]